MPMYSSHNIYNTYFLIVPLLWWHRQYITFNPPPLSSALINARLFHQHHCTTHLPSLSSSSVILPYPHHHQSYLESPMMRLLQFYLITIPWILHHPHCPASLPLLLSLLCTPTTVSIIQWLWSIFFAPFSVGKTLSRYLQIATTTLATATTKAVAFNLSRSLLYLLWPNNSSSIWLFFTDWSDTLHPDLLIFSPCSTILSTYQYFWFALIQYFRSTLIRLVFIHLPSLYSAPICSAHPPQLCRSFLITIIWSTLIVPLMICSAWSDLKLFLGLNHFGSAF